MGCDVGVNFIIRGNGVLESNEIMVVARFLAVAVEFFVEALKSSTVLTVWAFFERFVAVRRVASTREADLFTDVVRALVALIERVLRETRSFVGVTGVFVR